MLDRSTAIYPTTPTVMALRAKTGPGPQLWSSKAPIRMQLYGKMSFGKDHSRPDSPVKVFHQPELQCAQKSCLQGLYCLSWFGS